jgi:hypothetical protein
MTMSFSEIESIRPHLTSMPVILKTHSTQNLAGTLLIIVPFERRLIMQIRYMLTTRSTNLL